MILWFCLLQGIHVEVRGILAKEASESAIKLEGSLGRRNKMSIVERSKKETTC